MTSYSGPATLIVGAVEAPVIAHLTITAGGALASWHGRVHSGAGHMLWEAMEAPAVQLRIGDRLGDVIITAHSAGSEHAEITGSGTPPF